MLMALGMITLGCFDRLGRAWRCAVEKSDHRHRRLLGARCERPRRRPPPSRAMNARLFIRLTRRREQAASPVSKVAPATPPTSSSAPSVTTSASFSPGWGWFCASFSSRYLRSSQSSQSSNRLL